MSSDAHVSSLGEMSSPGMFSDAHVSSLSSPGICLPTPRCLRRPCFDASVSSKCVFSLRPICTASRNARKGPGKCPNATIHFLAHGRELYRLRSLLCSTGSGVHFERLVDLTLKRAELLRIQSTCPGSVEGECGVKLKPMGAWG